MNIFDNYGYNINHPGYYNFWHLYYTNHNFLCNELKNPLNLDNLWITLLNICSHPASHLVILIEFHLLISYRSPPCSIHTTRTFSIS